MITYKNLLYDLLIEFENFSFTKKEDEVSLLITSENLFLEDFIKNLKSNFSKYSCIKVYTYGAIREKILVHTLGSLEPKAMVAGKKSISLLIIFDKENSLALINDKYI